MALNVLFGKIEHGKLDAFYKNNLAGLPYYSDKARVVDLETAFFALDDDNNYKPTLFYHGKTANFRPDGLL